MGQNVPIQNSAELKLLQEGELELKGEFVWGSNYTFLVEISRGSEHRQGVYKPTQGQRPLWDFPRNSLAHREVAAYYLSEALGWSLVPPTAFRPDGPAGEGSLQLFVEHDPEYHYFNFSPDDRQRLRPTVLFDYVINNADRKGSHILIDPEGHLWLIDHGICFHEEEKLRTVIWDFCGEPIPSGLLHDLQSLQNQLTQDDDLLTRLHTHLSNAEIQSIASRTAWIINTGNFPDPPPNRRAHPWPPL